MTPIELMQAGKLHHWNDPEIQELGKKAEYLIERYNATKVDEDKTRKTILKELLGKCGDRCGIKPPFHCDYGKFIEIGEGTFINYDCIILDACKVTIGKHVLIGPRTCIYSASHPIYAPVRVEGYDVSKPVTIGDNVWLGGNVVVNPGVTIGQNTIIGAGSVVTKDIPSNVIAAGNPCKVIREITDEDRVYWEHERDEFLKNNN
jgi:maltose O-acetyltransferase